MEVTPAGKGPSPGSSQQRTCAGLRSWRHPAFPCSPAFCQSPLHSSAVYSGCPHPSTPSRLSPCTGPRTHPCSRETALAEAMGYLPAPEPSGHVPGPRRPGSFCCPLGLPETFPPLASGSSWLPASLAAAAPSLAGSPPHTSPSEASAPPGLCLVLRLSHPTLGRQVDAQFPGPPSGETQRGHRPQTQCSLVSHRPAARQTVGEGLPIRPLPPPEPPRGGGTPPSPRCPG